jgi:ubiquinone/menaquinone biosynthesis C-methylase UbiE
VTELGSTISQLVTHVVDKIPLHQSFMDSSLQRLEPSELQEFDAYMNFLLGNGIAISYLSDCYLTIVEDTLKEQIYFNKHHEYRHKSFSEVCDQVYFDDEYMSRYMYGLAISNFLWPNHVAMTRFYKESLPTQSAGAYLEIGPGHGQFMVTAIERGQFSEFVGVDLSATSIAQTSSIVQHFCPKHIDRVKFIQQDFLAIKEMAENSYGAIVMGEVLEHVEHPELFLQEMARLAAPDSYIFVTTCINAPAVDHIYLWRTLHDLEAMITDNGLTIRHKLYLPYTGKTLEEAEAEALPINTAFVLQATRHVR